MNLYFGLQVAYILDELIENETFSIYISTKVSRLILFSQCRLCSSIVQQAIGLREDANKSGIRGSTPS